MITLRYRYLSFIKLQSRFLLKIHTPDVHIRRALYQVVPTFHAKVTTNGLSMLQTGKWGGLDRNGRKVCG